MNQLQQLQNIMMWVGAMQYAGLFLIVVGYWRNRDWMLGLGSVLLVFWAMMNNLIGILILNLFFSAIAFRKQFQKNGKRWDGYKGGDR